MSTRPCQLFDLSMLVYALVVSYDMSCGMLLWRWHCSMRCTLVNFRFERKSHNELFSSFVLFLFFVLFCFCCVVWSWDSLCVCVCVFSCFHYITFLVSVNAKYIQSWRSISPPPPKSIIVSSRLLVSFDLHLSVIFAHHRQKVNRRRFRCQVVVFFPSPKYCCQSVPAVMFPCLFAAIVCVLWKSWCVQYQLVHLSRFH